MEIQKTQNSQSNPDKEKQSCRIRLSDFRLYYKAIAIKIVLGQKQKHRSMKKDRNSRNKPTPYDQLIYDIRGKNIQWRKVYSINGARKIGQLHVKR